MRPLLFDPSVELPMGRDPCEGCAEMGVGTPANLLSGAVGGAPFGPRSMSGVCRYWWSGCEPCLWGYRLSSLWDTIRWRGESKYAGGTLCESSQWCRTWNSQWGTFRVKGVAKWAEGRHANFDSGTIREPPRGA